ncbi:unnamed protein product [Cylicocyclus nassatus]|uniref:Uncharacterized protein n=1 Tax=Cylicocyclus nassatus TaxID=53992 RepID=A0AA36DKT0_CYLNA|nr:unnamed protein product [Cylicocyclus nassatus]
MEIWQIPRLMNRLMYDHIRDKDRSIYPYWRVTNYSLLHVENETEQVTESRPLMESKGKLNEVFSTDHSVEDRALHKLFSWGKKIHNSATRAISALRHQRSTRDDSKEDIVP